MRTKMEALNIEMCRIRDAIKEEKSRIYQTETAPKIRKLAGQCFVYRGNCYSLPGPDDYWDVYRKILDTCDDPDGCVRVIYEEFRIDNRGALRLTVDDECPSDPLNPFLTHYERLRPSQYNKQRAQFFEQLEKQDKLRTKGGE